MPSFTGFAPLFSLAFPLVLASGSPRRQQFLREWGVDFSIDVPEDAEPHPEANEAPTAYALRAARAKSAAILPRHPHSIVLAADTIVALNDDILGKPRDDVDALEMLSRLTGRTHHVITGVSLYLPDGRERAFSSRTAVTFAPWSREMLAAYVRTGEPHDKAGAYAIQGQGAFLVREIHGSWSTVVGLPVETLAVILTEEALLRPL